MGAKYTAGQKAASLSYQSKRAQIKITVSKDQREKYQQHAKDLNTNMTNLIISLLEKDIEEKGT